jgi:hypothetical protein
LTASEDATVLNFLQQIPKNNYAYIVIHGDKAGFKIFENKLLKPMGTTSLAKWIAANRVYDNQTIVLLSCKDPVSAQNLANSLYALDIAAKPVRTARKVIAWEGDVQLFENGFMIGNGKCNQYQATSLGSPSELTGANRPQGKPNTTATGTNLTLVRNLCLPIPEQYQIILQDWRYGVNSWTIEGYYANLVIKQPYDYERALINEVRTTTRDLTLLDAHMIFGYTTMFFYKNLNLWLRTGTNADKTNGVRQALNQALDKMAIAPANTDYFRGVAIADADLSAFLTEHKVGATVIYKEFISCANNLGDSFTANPKTNVKITLRTKVNSKIRTIFDLAYGKFKFGVKDEALIKSDSKFRVMSQDKAADGTYLINLKEID